MSRVVIPLKEIIDLYAAYTDEIVEKVAKEVLIKAKTTTAFKDRTGQLRRSGKKVKARYAKHKEERAWLVKFGNKKASQANLIEHGHRVVRRKDGTVTGHVPARPFLAIALAATSADLASIVAKVVQPTTRVGGR